MRATVRSRNIALGGDFEREGQRGNIRVEVLRHPCPYVPAIRFVIEAAA